MALIYQVPLSISQLGPIFSIRQSQSEPFGGIRKELTENRLTRFNDPDYPFSVCLILKVGDPKIKFDEIKNFLNEQNIDLKIFINVLKRNTQLGSSIRASSYEFYFRNNEIATLFKLFL